MSELVAKIENSDEEVVRSDDYHKLVDAGCTPRVAESLDSIFQDDLVQYSELDERAIEALKELDEDGAIAVLKQFRDSNLQVCLQLLLASLSAANCALFPNSMCKTKVHFYAVL